MFIIASLRWEGSRKGISGGFKGWLDELICEPVGNAFV